MSAPSSPQADGQDIGLVTDLLPPGVAGVESRGPVPPARPEEFDAAEVALLARAGARRRADFTGGRRCARAAMQALGHPPTPLLPDERGSPRWPAGLLGSITHTQGYRAAVATEAGVLRGVGIDAEPAVPVPDVLRARIVLPEEAGHQAELAQAHPDVPWLRLLFAAKEAVYKAWWPQEQRHLGFDGGAARFTVAATGDPSGTVTVPLRPPHAGRRFDGRWCMRSGLLVVVVVEYAVARPGGFEWATSAAAHDGAARQPRANRT